MFLVGDSIDLTMDPSGGYEQGRYYNPQQQLQQQQQQRQLQQQQYQLQQQQQHYGGGGAAVAAAAGGTDPVQGDLSAAAKRKERKRRLEQLYASASGSQVQTAQDWLKEDASGNSFAASQSSSNNPSAPSSMNSYGQQQQHRSSSYGESGDPRKSSGMGASNPYDQVGVRVGGRGNSAGGGTSWNTPPTQVPRQSYEEERRTAMSGQGQAGRGYYEEDARSHRQDDTRASSYGGGGPDPKSREYPSLSAQASEYRRQAEEAQGGNRRDRGYERDSDQYQGQGSYEQYPRINQSDLDTHGPSGYTGPTEVKRPAQGRGPAASWGSQERELGGREEQPRQQNYQRDYPMPSYEDQGGRYQSHQEARDSYSRGSNSVERGVAQDYYSRGSNSVERVPVDYESRRSHSRDYGTSRDRSPVDRRSRDNDRFNNRGERSPRRNRSPDRRDRRDPPGPHRRLRSPARRSRTPPRAERERSPPRRRERPARSPLPAGVPVVEREGGDVRVILDMKRSGPGPQVPPAPTLRQEDNQTSPGKNNDPRSEKPKSAPRAPAPRNSSDFVIFCKRETDSTWISPKKTVFEQALRIIDGVLACDDAELLCGIKYASKAKDGRALVVLWNHVEKIEEKFREAVAGLDIEGFKFKMTNLENLRVSVPVSTRSRFVDTEKIIPILTMQNKFPGRATFLGVSDFRMAGRVAGRLIKFFGDEAFIEHLNKFPLGHKFKLITNKVLLKSNPEFRSKKPYVEETSAASKEGEKAGSSKETGKEKEVSVAEPGEGDDAEKEEDHE